MRLVLQRVKRASVEIEGRINGAIEGGLLIFAGFTDTDTAELIPTAVSKVIQMRIFADQAGKLNLSLLDTGGSILIISQFTLYANCSRGHRPDFTHAAAPDKARALYDELISQFKATGINIQTGIFAADMQVDLLNDGPITIILDY